MNRRTAIKALAAMPLVASGATAFEWQPLRHKFDPATFRCVQCGMTKLKIITDMRYQCGVLMVKVRNVTGQTIQPGQAVRWGKDVVDA